MDADLAGASGGGRISVFAAAVGVPVLGALTLSDRAVCNRLIRDDRLFEVIPRVDRLFKHKVRDIGTCDLGGAFWAAACLNPVGLRKGPVGEASGAHDN